MGTTHQKNEWSSETIPFQDRIHVTFRNMMDETGHLFWVSSGNEDINQGEILPGRNIAQNTYPGHVFAIKDAQGVVKVMIKIGGQVNIAIVFNNLNHCVATADKLYKKHLQ